MTEGTEDGRRRQIDELRADDRRRRLPDREAAQRARRARARDPRAQAQRATGGSTTRKREEQIFENLGTCNEGPLFDDNLREIYETILHVMKELRS